MNLRSMMLLEALMFLLWHEAPPAEQNFEMIMELIDAMEVSEEDENFVSPLDILFECIAMKNPAHIAVSYYNKVTKGSAKTLKSVLITLITRLDKFNLPPLATLTRADDMALPTIGEEKTALFAVIPDNDSSFNFVVGMLYTQLFQSLMYLADHKYGGRLPIHVHFVMDEFANVVLSLVMIMSVYGRFFKLYLYTAIAPIPLAAFAGEPSQSIGKSFLKGYAAVCLEGAVIVLGCVIFSVFAASPPVVNTTAAPVTMVWSYVGELIFNMLILVGTVKMADRVVREMLGL